MRLSWEEVEQRRDRLYRRTRELRVTSVREALAFVNQVGFCFAFAAQRSELPCLWHAVCGERNPQMPEHIQHDWSIGLVWEAKDVLAAEKKIYYGKALRSRPTMISLEYFPYFCSARGIADDAADYLHEYRRGHLSPAAKRIMDALVERSPRITRELKEASRLASPAQRYEFDRAMAELQMKLYIVKVAELYEPFTFVWDLVVRRFAAEVERARDMEPQQARTKILEKYFSTVLVSSPLHIARLFDWEPHAIRQALAELHAQGKVMEVDIEGESRNWLLSASWETQSLSR
ncbi:MAG: winged helix DNA-binding domain-containing protein [Calditrichaeota bacterium]|nr:winged helix DNA-binding domain-containing protein [Calditrichota bacterium]